MVALEGVKMLSKQTPPQHQPVKYEVSILSWTFANAHRLVSTYVVRSLLILISLLILSGLGLIWSALLVVERLPSLTKNLANLTCSDDAS